MTDSRLTNEPIQITQFAETAEWFLRHWRTCAVSLISCLLGCFLFLHYATPRFERTSAFTLRYTAYGDPMSGTLSAFQDIAQMQQGPVLDNEFYFFKSSVFTESVVRALSLEYSYYFRDFTGRTADLYGKSPVKLSISGIPPHTETLKFDIHFLSEGSNLAVLSGFMLNGERAAGNPEFTATTNDSVETPFGTIRLHPTEYAQDYKGKHISATYTAPHLAAKSLLENLQLGKASQYSTVLVFTYRDASAQRAEDILNTLPAVYNRLWNEYVSQTTLKSNNFLNNRLPAVERQLTDTERQISEYLSSNRIVNDSTEAKKVIRDLGVSENLIFNASTEQDIATNLLKYLTDGKSQNDLIPSNVGISNPHLQTAIADYNRKMLEVIALRSASSDSNPSIAERLSELTGQRNMILNSIRQHISTLRIQEEKAAAKSTHASAQIPATATHELKLRELYRQQETLQDQYLFLLKKLEENALASQLGVDAIRIIEHAEGNDSPVFPDSGLALLIAAVSGALIIPLSIKRIKENTRKFPKKELEKLSVAIAGELPDFDSAPKKSLFRKMASNQEVPSDAVRLLFQTQGAEQLTEALRKLRANLLFMTAQGPDTPIILSAPFSDGNGANFTLNMAACMAEAGKSTLLIDADLRNPQISALIGSPRPGLSDYLNDSRITAKETIAKRPFASPVDILPAGSLPPNPAELLLSDRLERLTRELKADYDFIFLHCPPISRVADARAASRAANRTVIALPASCADSRTTQKIGELHQRKAFPNMSVAICNSDSRQYN